jgi:ribonuclease Z
MANDSDNCNAVRLQFDAGRGTSLRLSQVDVLPEQLSVMFFTHMHSDHVGGFMQFALAQRGLDIVCSADASSAVGHTLSCRTQRVTDDGKRPAGGLADLANVMETIHDMFWQDEKRCRSSCRPMMAGLCNQDHRQHYG